MMNKTKEERAFWGKVACHYNRFAKTKLYQRLYQLIRVNIDADTEVLDIGCASGLISRAIADKAKLVQAVDYSEEMIAEAEKITKENNVCFSVQDSTALTFPDQSFDVVIIANVLHIVENPTKILKEVKRVLRKDGMLIAPVYVWEDISFRGRVRLFFMKLKGFPIHTKWSSEGYLSFLESNGFTCSQKVILDGVVDMCYVECFLAK